MLNLTLVGRQQRFGSKWTLALQVVLLLAVVLLCSAPLRAACGDGMIDGMEGCDDGNLTPGDGCNSMCFIENGGMCSVNQACASGTCEMGVCSGPVCGDGMVEGSEGCDDGGQVNGDGCNALCYIEDGSACMVNASCASGMCVMNVCVGGGGSFCGDGMVNGMEGCDDGGQVNGDGCNAMCFIEDGSACMANASCASGMCLMNVCIGAPVCGNGATEGTEGCDDGNLLNGDGCNATCKREDGQGCDTNESCASGMCNMSVCFGSVFALDVDANGSASPLTDGLLVLRYLFGFRGSVLTNSAVAGNCTRCMPGDIENFLAGLIPP